MGDMADFYSLGGWCEDYDEDRKLDYFEENINKDNETIIKLAKDIKFDDPDDSLSILVKNIIQYYDTYKKLSYKQKSVLVNSNFYYYEF